MTAVGQTLTTAKISQKLSEMFEIGLKEKFTLLHLMYLKDILASLSVHCDICYILAGFCHYCRHFCQNADK